MGKITTILFDFDGTLVDTESQYDLFLDELEKRLQLGIDNFPAKLKGKKVDEALKTDFSTLTNAVREKIMNELVDFELNKMKFPLVPGVMDFIHYLKQNKFKIGLVTSSDSKKMSVAKKLLGIEGLFDIEVVAEDVKQGKPNPSCYLLAAKRLNQAPASCVVFEDSLAGLAAAKAAGMVAIAISTSLPKEELRLKTENVIADFLNIEQLKSFLN